MATAFVEVHESGEVKIAAMFYTKRGRTTLRLPMGKGKKFQRESLTDTQIREASQEAAEDPGNFAYEFVFQRLVCYKVCPDDHNPETELHLKACMVARITKGNLRNHRSVDQEFDEMGRPIPEEEEILDPLVMYEVRECLNLMSERGRGLPVHITFVLATLVALAAKYPKVERRYSAIVTRDDVLERVRISPEHKDQVSAYVQLSQS